MDCTDHGIFQARILEWVTIPFSRGSSQPRDRTQVYPHCRQILYQLNHKASLWYQLVRILMRASWPFTQLAALIKISFCKISPISCPQLLLRHLLLLSTDGFRLLTLSPKTQCIKSLLYQGNVIDVGSLLVTNSATDAYAKITDCNGLNNTLPKFVSTQNLRMWSYFAIGCLRM